MIRKNLPEGRPRFPNTVEYGDIVAGLPVEENQCRAIYCSHVLEHLSLEDCKRALRNTYSYLEPGGIFRFVMPDLRGLAEAYLAHDSSDAAHMFMERAWLGKKTRPQSLAKKLISSTGNADHLWMWDYASMSTELESAGFTNIRRAQFGDSEEPRFADVESRDRWEEPGFGGNGGGKYSAWESSAQSLDNCRPNPHHFTLLS